MILHNDTWFGQRDSLAMCSKFAVYLANVWMKSFGDKVSGHFKRDFAEDSDRPDIKLKPKYPYWICSGAVTHSQYMAQCCKCFF